MTRLNEEGYPRESLSYVLTQARFVKEARHIDRCLLCRNTQVNEAGLCIICMSMIDNEHEIRLIQTWLEGRGCS